MSLKSPAHSNRILLALFMALLFSFTGALDSEALALSIEEERMMGEEFLVQVRAQFEILDDEFANQYINVLGHYLLIPLETKFFPFYFYIIKDNTPNAFAAPGGHIFVFSGLIEVLDRTDELAAIVCHEIGHVSARHLAHRIEQNKKIGIATLAGILAGLFLGGPATTALITGSLAAGMQAQLYYSRGDERQADQLSFKYITPSGFDPRGMITALKKIEKGSWLGSDKIPTYLLTHPTGPERMSNLEVMLSSYTPEGQKEEAARLAALFPFFKTIIQAKCLDPHDARRLFDRDLKKDPESVFAHLGLGIVDIESLEYPNAIRHLEKASALCPDFVPILTNLGTAYQMSGQETEAIKVIKKALRLDRNNKAALFLLGVSYENLKQYASAVEIFERLASFSPVKDEVYYHLGICYGRKNSLVLAHYNFGIYFRKIGKIGKARFHFQKADKLCGSNCSLKKKIGQAVKDLPPEKMISGP